MHGATPPQSADFMQQNRLHPPLEPPLLEPELPLLEPEPPLLEPLPPPLLPLDVMHEPPRATFACASHEYLRCR